MRPSRKSARQRRGQRDGSLPSYQVGYAKPPKHTQFKPGQSGNRRGRRKKRDNLQEIVAKILFEKMEVRIGGRTQRVASVNALIRMAMSRALTGDYKFLTAVISFIRMAGLSDGLGGEFESAADSATEEAILADFLRRKGVALKPPSGNTRDNRNSGGGNDAPA